MKVHPAALLLTTTLSVAAAADAVAAGVVVLKNAATPGLQMPLSGLGTGGYGNAKAAPLGVYPECWTDNHPDASGKVPHPGVDCGAAVTNATVTWLKSGGRRIDHGDSYEDLISVGAGIKDSGVPRSEIFITTKVGDGGLGLGAKDIHTQFEYYLQQTGTSYVDLLLIHWPTSGDNSSTPVCQMRGASYDATACRLDSWKALLAIMAAGKAKAVGVSNFNTAHLQEIIDAKLPLPSVNQCPYNPHLHSAQAELLAMCKKHDIIFNSYSPLGIPDFHKYLGQDFSLVEDPKLKPLAKKHGLSPAQILLAWQAGIGGMVFNPRSMNRNHMLENLDPKVAATKLDEADLKVLESFPPDKCSSDNSWYECCGGSQKSIPSCGEGH